MQTGLESAPKETENETDACLSSRGSSEGYSRGSSRGYDKGEWKGDLRATQWDMRTRPKASRLSPQRTPPASATTSNNCIVIHPAILPINEVVKHTGLTMGLR